jgi:Zn-dependent peptidase ImmA (M78 family)
MIGIIQKATQIYRKYGSIELDFIAGKFGVTVYETLSTEKIKEVYFPDLKAIAIVPNLDLRERNYLIAHALGHHFLHRIGLYQDYINLHENGLLGSLEIGRSELARKEKEADLFAAYFLIPEERLNAILAQDWFRESPNQITTLAEEFQVPEELARKRLEFKKIFTLNNYSVC